ncbi:MAG: hypothetical protein J6R48_07265 [Muribaculaceae bacterium]|nr:hypothetical protein [Muribaculaceae bacterium]
MARQTIFSSIGQTVTLTFRPVSLEASFIAIFVNRLASGNFAKKSATIVG